MPVYLVQGEGESRYVLALDFEDALRTFRAWWIAEDAKGYEEPQPEFYIPIESCALVSIDDALIDPGYLDARAAEERERAKS